MDVILLLLTIICIYCYKVYYVGAFKPIETVHAIKDEREIGYNIEMTEKQNAFMYYVNSVERLNNG